jgi:putative endonuclease
MTLKRKQTGAIGEAMAGAHLKQAGYELVAQNWRCALGEVDVIARDPAEGEMLVFIEVRTRRSRRLGSPEESITPAKQAKLIELAYTYLQEHHPAEIPAWRIDVIAIVLNRHNQAQHFQHLKWAVGA